MQQQHQHTSSALPLPQLPINLRPLCVPQSCDDTHKVHVQLDQPLWSTSHQRSSHTADILSYCIQLDTMITPHNTNITNVPDNGKKSVTFQHGFTSNVVTILDKMAEVLNRKGIKCSSVEEYLCSSGLVRLFPRVVEYLRNPDNPDSAHPSQEMEGYMAQVTALHNMLVLAQQLQTNIQTSVSHKYIAHQLALLYQTLAAFGEPLIEHKKSIESRFIELKTVCSTDGGTHTPRLTADLQKWLLTVTSEIMEASTSLSRQLTMHLIPVATLVNGLNSL